MSLRINLNSAGLTAHRMLSASDNALSKSIEKLSSGFKINNAGDDPAGLVISEKLRAQVSGLGQAIRNAGDAVNMVKTAEGALNEVHRLLRSMRDLAVHAANTGANDAAAIAADQAQIDSAIDSIDKIALETQFGNKKLLDGSAGIKATAIGTAATAADFSAATLTADTTVSVNTAVGVGGVAAAKATMTNSVDLSAGAPSDAEIEINGVAVSFLDADDIDDMTDKINLVADQTGVVATNDGTNITLTQKEFGSNKRIDVTGTDALAIWGAASAAAIGTDAVAVVTQTGGTNVSDALWNSGNGLVLEDSLGNTINLTAAAGAVASDKGSQFSVEVGTLTFQVGAYADQTRSLSISSVSSTYLGTTAVTGENVSTIDVSTSTGATDAINILDEAITNISTLRASLGATQKNTLESSINSLTIAKENIAASESTIRDTDMAAEMVDFTRNQILQQAGVSMLAQANQAPQALLSLLR